jgi:predicted lysophospholipase L1 biosynthesis ABC-type transport system permease subunit
VGVDFAFVIGWILTIIVNTILAALLEAILAAPPTKFYLGTFFLTAVSISLMGISEIVGNRFFRKRFAATGLGILPIMISALSSQYWS